MLHGSGGSGSSLLPLAQAWRNALTRTHFVAPDAPNLHPRGFGRQWFGIDGGALTPERITSVRHAFDAIVTELIEREGFQDRHADVAFVGISQGAIMALDGLASGRWQIGALVSFAGLLPPMPVSRTHRDTPVLLVHGGADTTIPPMASSLAARQLKQAGFSVDLTIEPGVGHTISPSGAALALDFLCDKLKRGGRDR